MMRFGRLLWISRSHGIFDLQETLARAVFNAVRSMKTVEGLRVRTSKPDVYKDVNEAAYQLSDLA